jgi:hypothetical protein
MSDARIVHEFGSQYKQDTLETHYYRIVYIYSNEHFVRHAEGMATCEPTDKYNEGFGKRLAKVKAYEAYYRKVKKLMIAETHRPEWRKKPDTGAAIEALEKLIQKTMIDLKRWVEET